MRNPLKVPVTAWKNAKRAKVIYCDVDNTLLLGGRLNGSLVRWLKDRREEGYQLNVWSARGEEVALAAVDLADIGGIVNASLSKPGTVVDDMGWKWVKHTTVINPQRIT